MNINNSKPESRKKDIVVQELEDEVLVYDLLKNKAFCLNKTSAVIWQACNGERTTDEIAEVCSRKLRADVTPEMIWLALEQFNKDNLLERGMGEMSLFNGMSRREVIRKVSVGSLIALPIVSSLVAPKAIQAQSNCVAPNAANGCTCGAAGNCTSKCCGTDGMNATCVTPAQDASGSVCRAACECAGNCCAGGTCFTAKAFAAGTACVSACQCQNTCSGGFCT